MGTDLVAAVKERVSLIRIVEKYCEVKGVTGHYVCCCPFHEEKTPSFHIYEDRFYCFGCQERGDVINFVCNIEGWDFKTALEYLCELAGIDFKNNNSSQENSKKTKRKEIRTLSLNIFRKNFLKSHGLQRKFKFLSLIENENLETFSVGYSGISSFYFIKEIKRNKLSLKESFELGILARDIDGTYCLRVRDAIVFPVQDLLGNIIDFDFVKIVRSHIVNSTRTFIQANMLYGLYHSKKYIKKNKKVFFCYSTIDTILLYQSNIRNVCGILYQLNSEIFYIMKTMTTHVVLISSSNAMELRNVLFDAMIALQNFFLCDIIVLPEDETIQSILEGDEGKERLLSIFSYSISAIEAVALFAENPLEYVVFFFKNCSQVVYPYYIKEFSIKLGLDEEKLYLWIQENINQDKEKENENGVKKD